MGSEIPLNLYDCMYEDDGIHWQYNNNTLNKVLYNLNKMQVSTSIK